MYKIAQELIDIAARLLYSTETTWQNLGYDESMAQRMLQRYGPPKDKDKIHFKVKNAYKSVSQYDYNLSTPQGHGQYQKAVFQALDKAFPGVLTQKDVDGLFHKLHKKDSAIGMDLHEWTTDLIEKKLLKKKS